MVLPGAVVSPNNLPSDKASLLLWRGECVMWLLNHPALLEHEPKARSALWKINGDDIRLVKGTIKTLNLIIEGLK